MSARRIAFTTAAQILGKFLGFFISSFFLVILSGSLGTTGMGYYTTITAFLTFFTTLADLGISTVMIREISQNPERREQLTGEFISIRITYGFVIMMSAPLVAMLIPQYRGIIAAGTIVAAVGQFFLLLNQAYVGILQINTRLDKAVYAELANRVVTLGLTGWGAHLYAHNLNGFLIYVLWVVAAGAFVNLIICWWAAKQYWSVTPRFGHGRWKELTLMVLPMGGLSFLGMVHFRSDTIILSLIKGPHDVGIYGYAYKIGEILLSIPGMFIGVIFPQLSRLYTENLEQFRSYGQKVFTSLAFLTFPLILGIFSLAPYLTVMLSRQSLADGVQAGNALRILCLAMFCWYFGTFYQNMLLVGKQYKGLIRNMSIAVVCNLLLNSIAIPFLSYYGAAWTTVTTETIMLVLTIVYVREKTGFVARLDGFLPMIAATAAMCGSVFAYQRYVGGGLTAFSTASRLHQLVVLLPMTAVGGVVFLLVMLLWGRNSPLYFFFSLVRKSS